MYPEMSAIRKQVGCAAGGIGPRRKIESGSTILIALPLVRSLIFSSEGVRGGPMAGGLHRLWRGHVGRLASHLRPIRHEDRERDRQRLERAAFGYGVVGKGGH